MVFSHTVDADLVSPCVGALTFLPTGGGCRSSWFWTTLQSILPMFCSSVSDVYVEKLIVDEIDKGSFLWTLSQKVRINCGIGKHVWQR